MDVLLVEDDLELGNGLRIALADQGLNVVWVRRAAEAEAALDDALAGRGAVAAAGGAAGVAVDAVGVAPLGPGTA